MYVVSQIALEKSITAGACSSWACLDIGWNCAAAQYNTSCYTYDMSKCDPLAPPNASHGTYGG